MEGSAVYDNAPLSGYFYVVRNKIVLVSDVTFELTKINVSRRTNLIPTPRVLSWGKYNVKVRSIGRVQVL